MAAAADGAPADVASSAKLQSMLEGFGSFERVLQNGTRQRREQDEFRIAELRNIIKDVEAQVAQESDRRVEAAKALQAWAETQVLAVRTRLEEQLTSSHTDVVARIGALNDRVAKLEQKFEEDRIKTLEEVEKRNRDLVAELRAFHDTFEAERKSRLEREQRILDRLGAAEHEADSNWNKERSEREQIYMAVKKRLEDAVETRTRIDDKFQSGVFLEIAAIKNGIAAEAKAREAEDDAIAANLNAYVQKLQASLALINSEDTDF